MKKLLPIILAAVMLLAALTACSEPNNIDATEIPSQEPSAQVTQNAQQTEAPTEEPVSPYNEYECGELRKFFDAPSKVNGLSNGELLNPDYVSGDPSTWSNYEEDKDGNFIYIEWTDDGHVSTLSFGKNSEDKANKALLGFINIDGFEQLKYFGIYNSELEEVTLKDCPGLWNFDFRDCAIASFDISSDSFPSSVEFGDGFSTLHWLCHDGVELFDILLSTDFRIDETSSARAYITCKAYMDESEVGVIIDAFAPDGYKFDGWYDTDGNLVSSDHYYILPIDDKGFVQGTHHYTAKFTEE